MKDTIKAKFGYKVRRFTGSFGETKQISDYGDKCLVFDGNKVLFAAQIVPMEKYKDECENGNNECAVKNEVFTTIKNNQFIYWSDIETGEDFLTKIEKNSGVA